MKQSFLGAALAALFLVGCKHTDADCCVDEAATKSTNVSRGASVGGSNSPIAYQWYFKTSAPPAAATSSDTQIPFDGKTLTGWTSTDFAGRGEVSVKNGELILGNGYMTGVTRTGAVPKMNYEISLDAKRTEGSDFFCGLTFPVGEDFVSFIVGGWGGSTTGISSVDSEDASSNETTGSMNFVNGKWYHIRVRVTPGKINAWIDEDQVVKLDTTDRRLSTRLEVDASKPLGVATWNTAAALKNIQLKTLK